jgi:NAD(P)H-hydrate epimerase
MASYLSRAEVRAFDRWAIDEVGIPGLVLMENAGRGAVDILLAQAPPHDAVICCGKGNNGGDGLVMARHLWNRAVPVKVLLFAAPETLTPDAAAEWRIVQRLAIPAEVWPGTDVDETRLRSALQGGWVVDALFGSGLDGPVRAPFDRIIAAINASPGRVLAVDIPSGLNADTGAPMGPTVRSHHTVTFVAPKLGYRQPGAAAWLGQLHVVDIGVARKA